MDKNGQHQANTPPPAIVHSPSLAPIFMLIAVENRKTQGGVLALAVYSLPGLLSYMWVLRLRV